jgi:hypothetical protein
VVTAAELKTRLQERALGLQKQRAEVQASCDARLAHLDQQLAAVRQLAQNWDTMSLDEAIGLLAETGVTLEVRS